MQTATTLQKITQAADPYLVACELLNQQPLTAEAFAALAPFGEQQAFHSLHRITTVTKAVKEGKVLDYGNSRQWKWYPWFYMRPSGFGFSGTSTDCDDTHSDVGSRLSSFSDDEAEAIAKCMLKDYEVWMTEQK